MSDKLRDEVLTAEEEANIMNKMMLRFFRPFFVKLITKEDVELLRELEKGREAR